MSLWACFPCCHPVAFVRELRWWGQILFSAFKQDVMSCHCTQDVSELVSSRSNELQTSQLSIFQSRVLLVSRLFCSRKFSGLLEHFLCLILFSFCVCVSGGVVRSAEELRHQPIQGPQEEKQTCKPKPPLHRYIQMCKGKKDVLVEQLNLLGEIVSGTGQRMLVAILK